MFRRKPKGDDAATPEATASDHSGEPQAPATGLDEWEALDRSRDWRTEGPFDESEVDLDDDETLRVDLGALVLTPFEGCEVRLQGVEGTPHVRSALIIAEDSAMEIMAMAAPREGGLWAEIRPALMAEVEHVGGSVEPHEGPFGTELVRQVPVRTPDGQTAVQPSRVWVAEGPRWALVGTVMGRAALVDDLEDPVLAPFHDAFRDVVVRRGDQPRAAGDLLLLDLPAGAQPAEQGE